jgi:hypothetical protein
MRVSSALVGFSGASLTGNLVFNYKRVRLETALAYCAVFSSRMPDVLFDNECPDCSSCR